MIKNHHYKKLFNMNFLDWDEIIEITIVMISKDDNQFTQFSY